MRHIKRYEEFETYPYQEPVPEPKYELKDPVLDATPYPREEDEDRSYEEAEALRQEAAKQLQGMGRETILKLLAPETDMETYEDILLRELMAERRAMLKGEKYNG